MFPWLTLSKGENVDVIKAEHIDRQKRSMDDHKRLDAVAAESWSALCNAGASWSASWELQYSAASANVRALRAASQHYLRRACMHFHSWTRSENARPLSRQCEYRTVFRQADEALIGLSCMHADAQKAS